LDAIANGHDLGGSFDTREGVERRRTRADGTLISLKCPVMAASRPASELFPGTHRYPLGAPGKLVKYPPLEPSHV